MLYAWRISLMRVRWGFFFLLFWIYGLLIRHFDKIRMSVDETNRWWVCGNIIMYHIMAFRSASTLDVCYYIWLTRVLIHSFHDTSKSEWKEGKFRSCSNTKRINKYKAPSNDENHSTAFIFFMWSSVWMPLIHFMIFICFGFYVNWLLNATKFEIPFKKADDNKLYHFWITLTAQPNQIIIYIFCCIFGMSTGKLTKHWRRHMDTWMTLLSTKLPIYRI